jgi:pSer/pThr/pTyr-binding forkhead associated (FHA) protein
MPDITLRILDGADRGRNFERLSTPITIGREEGNSIQLNDERVSRFHLKIQADKDKIVLTDLQSTNGTKVNGEDIQLRILRYGDLINVGRSVILFGNDQQINERIAEIRKQNADPDAPQAVSADMPIAGEGTASQHGAVAQPRDFDFHLNWHPDYDYQHELHRPQAPALPTGLSPSQTAELSELLDYMHIRLRAVLKSARVKGPLDLVVLEYEPWQQLLLLQGKIAEYLRIVGDPPEE